MWRPVVRIGASIVGSSNMARLFVVLIVCFATNAASNAGIPVDSSVPPEIAPLVGIFGQELAGLLKPDGLEKYLLERKLDDIHRDLAKESMGYGVRVKRAAGLSRSIRQTSPAQTVYPLNAVRQDGFQSSCPQTSTTSMVRVNSTTGIVVSACSPGSSTGNPEAVLYWLALNSTDPKLVEFMRFELDVDGMPTVSCAYLWGRAIYVVFSDPASSVSELYIIDITSTTPPSAPSQLLANAGELSSCVIFDHADTLALVVVHSLERLGGHVSLTTEARCYLWRGLTMDIASTFTTVAAKHVATFKYNKRRFLAVSQPKGPDGQLDGGRVMLYEVSSTGKVLPYQELVVPGAVQSHGLISQNYLILLCAKSQGDQNLYVWAADRLIDFHNIGTASNPNGLELQYTTSFGWTHYVAQDGRVVAFLFTNEAIYCFVQESTGHFQLFHRINIASPLFLGVSKIERLAAPSSMNKVFVGVTGTSATMSNPMMTNDARVYILDVPVAPAGKPLEVTENELQQCLMDLEKVLAEKLPALEEIKTELSTCLPRDGSKGLNATKVVIEGDAMVEGNLEAGSVEALPGSVNSTRPRSETELEKGIQRFHTKLDWLAAQVEDLQLMQPAATKTNLTTEIEVGTMTVTVDQLRGISVNNKNISRLFTHAWRRSAPQNITGRIRVQNCSFLNLEITETGKLNNYSLAEYVKLDQPANITGNYNFLGTVMFEKGVNFGPSGTINGIDPRKLCLKTSPTTLTEDATFDHLRILEKIDVTGTVNGVRLGTEAPKYFRTDVPNQRIDGHFTFASVRVESGNVVAKTIGGRSIDSCKDIAFADETGTVTVNSNVHFSGNVIVTKNTKVNGPVVTDTAADLSTFVGNITVKNLTIGQLLINDGLNGIPCSKFVDLSSEQTITVKPNFGSLSIESLRLEDGAKLDTLDPTIALSSSQISLTTLSLTKNMTIGKLEILGSSQVKSVNGMDVEAELGRCVKKSEPGQVIDNLKAKRVVIQSNLPDYKTMSLNGVPLSDYWLIGPDAGLQTVTAPVTMTADVTMVVINTPDGVPFGSCHYSPELADRIVTISPLNSSDPASGVEISGLKSFHRMVVSDHFYADTINGKNVSELLGPAGDIYKDSALHFKHLEIIGNASVWSTFNVSAINGHDLSDAMANAVYKIPIDGQPQVVEGHVVFGNSLEVNDLNATTVDNAIPVLEVLRHAVTTDSPQEILPTIIAQGTVYFNGHVTSSKVNGVDYVKFLTTDMIKKSQVESGNFVVPNQVHFNKVTVAGNIDVTHVDQVNVAEVVKNALSKTVAQVVQCNATFNRQVETDNLKVVSINGIDVEDFVFSTTSAVNVDANKELIFDGDVTLDSPLYVVDGHLIGKTTNCSITELYDKLKAQNMSSDPTRLEGVQSASSITVTGDCRFEDKVNDIDVMTAVRDAVLSTSSSAALSGNVVFGNDVTIQNLNCSSINGYNLAELMSKAWSPGSNSLGSAGPIKYTQPIVVDNLYIQGSMAGGAVNGMNIAEIINARVANTDAVKTQILSPVNFTQGLKCKKAFVNGALGPANTVEDFVKIGDTRYISGTTMFNAGLEVGNLEVDTINGKPLTNLLTDYLTKDRNGEEFHYDLILGKNSHIRTICADTLNGVPLDQIATVPAPGTPLQVSGAKDIDGSLTVNGNITVSTFNGKPFSEFMKEYLTESDTDVRLPGRLTLSGPITPGTGMKVEIRETVDGQKITDFLRNVELWTMNAPDQGQQAHGLVNLLAREVDQKSRDISLEKSQRVMSFFEDLEVHSQPAGVQQFVLRARADKLQPPVIGAFVELSTDFCMAYETRWYNMDATTQKIVPADGIDQVVSGRSYVHHEPGSSVAAKLATNIEVDFYVPNRPVWCSSSAVQHYQNLHSLKVEDNGNTANVQFLPTDSSVGDVKFIKWHDSTYAFIGYSYNITASSTNATLAVMKLNPTTYTFEPVEQEIVTQGLKSIALLPTEDALFVALCNHFDVAGKTGEVHSEIYFMKKGENQLRLLQAVKTHYCSRVVAMLTDSNRSPTFVFAELQRDVTVEGASFTSLPTAVKFTNYDPASTSGYNLVLSSLKDAFGVIDMAHIKFNERDYVAVVSTVKNLCQVYQDKGPEGFVLIQSIPVQRPTAVAAIVTGDVCVLVVGTERGTRTYKAHLITPS